MSERRGARMPSHDSKSVWTPQTDIAWPLHPVDAIGWCEVDVGCEVLAATVGHGASRQPEIASDATRAVAPALPDAAGFIARYVVPSRLSLSALSLSATSSALLHCASSL